MGDPEVTCAPSYLQTPQAANEWVLAFAAGDPLGRGARGAEWRGAEPLGESDHGVPARLVNREVNLMVFKGAFFKVHFFSFLRGSGWIEVESLAFLARARLWFEEGRPFCGGKQTGSVQRRNTLWEPIYPPFLEVLGRKLSCWFGFKGPPWVFLRIRVP